MKEFFGDNLNGSNNHAMFSSYTSWLFQALGGITVAEEAVGADVILISSKMLSLAGFLAKVLPMKYFIAMVIMN
ncbi:hypothetical protein KAM622c_24520 [Klebsiella quasipneumoniae subsp. quasipneumoniae]|nr:hypothetical protein KAM622c_24520 [Klebsiella quasipneumoniae subsp. quasipneumoniae]